LAGLTDIRARGCGAEQETWSCCGSGSASSSLHYYPPGTGEAPADGSSSPTVPFPAETCGEEADRLPLNEESVTGGAQGKTSAKPAWDDCANQSRGKAESLPPPEP